MPECAIFADTQSEPASVYRWLDWLEKQLPYPLHRVTLGNLGEAACNVRTSKAGTTYLKHNVPVFMRQPGTDEEGIMRRHCTGDFKIDMIHRELRRLGGRKRGVVQWIGISRDEVNRLKPSGKKWITNIWPLVFDREMRREDCLRWMEEKGFPRPPRSSCVFCPYHSVEEWRRLRDEEPAEFARAVAWERDYQDAVAKVPSITGTPFLHRSLVPLSDVDLSVQNEPDLFTNECTGMCGS